MAASVVSPLGLAATSLRLSLRRAAAPRRPLSARPHREAGRRPGACDEASERYAPAKELFAGDAVGRDGVVAHRDRHVRAEGFEERLGPLAGAALLPPPGPAHHGIQQLLVRVGTVREPAAPQTVVDDDGVAGTREQRRPSLYCGG